MPSATPNSPQTAYQGLSATDAATRLQRDGFNELAGSKPKSVWRIALSVLKEPMLILLVSCSTLYLLLGDLEGGLVLMFCVTVVIAITIFQERKTERALDALKDLASPRALVMRDGQEVRIAGREVVVGDVLVLREGDRIPADARLQEATNLMVDESLLTGESLPVSKILGEPAGEEPQLFSSTLVVGGTCIAEATKTGKNTRVGEIGKAIEGEKGEKTGLQLEMNKLVKWMGLSALVTCLLVVAGYYFVRGGFIKALLAGLSLAMSMLPEELPVVFTVFMALGAWRIAKRHVLTAKPSAIETLGATTVLCSDKTGTLTLNKMSVKCLFAMGNRMDMHVDTEKEIPEDYHVLVEYGILASQIDPFDPMEKAIKALGERKLLDAEHLHQDWELLKEFPLSKELLAMSRAFRQPKSEERVIAAKGAPEAIFELCHLPENEVAELTAEIKIIAAAGLRVIAVARSTIQANAMPEEQHAFDFELCGLIGLADPIRPEAAQAIAECRAAGIHVVMITGDYPETAVSIAREIGLESPEEVITGPELAAMSDTDLAARLKVVRVFARIMPEQKLKLVKAFQANGEVVAMTGDGVNDAPALKAAHIGIAMGQKGTDVAREAASLVLLDDNFTSIVAAIRLGRKIYDNIQKAFGYVISIHLPIAGLAFIPVMWEALPLLLWPVHIALLELIIDPASSVAFESVAEEHDIMARKPRARDQRFIVGRQLWVALLNGGFMLGLLLCVFFYALHIGFTDGQTRSLTFLSLIAANAALILSGLSRKRHLFQTLRDINAATVWLLSGVAVFVGLMVLIPFLRELFQLELFPVVYSLFALGVFLVQLVWMEASKWIFR